MTRNIAVLVFLVGGTTAANYFLVVRPANEQTRRQEGIAQTLESELARKPAIAQAVQRTGVLQWRLQMAMPSAPDIDGLIRSLREIAQNAGLIVNDITPQAEQRQSLYASMPIAMAVTGTYHEIRVFFDGVSKLAPIVNVTNIKLGAPEMRGEKVVVHASYVATTYRLVR
ncbi:MAG: type 4a pilus biogenesis protein PilO [Myxococcales bacterium]